MRFGALACCDARTRQCSICGRCRQSCFPMIRQAGLSMLDPTFLTPSNACRSISQRSLGVPTPRQSVDEHSASAAAGRGNASQGSSPLTHPTSSGPPPVAQLEAAYEQQHDSVTTQLEAAGLIPEWLKKASPGEAPKQRRIAFPKPKQKLPTINIFNIIKDWIGEPLSRLVSPTYSLMCGLALQCCCQ